jgi:PHD/YefM family antitoxin component YafN of YafNO toxin-antitoxin module
MSSAKIVTAKRWRDMETTEILQSIEIAARVLETRSWSNEELKHLALVISDLAQLLRKVL